MLNDWIGPIDDYSESFAGKATTIGLDGREWILLLLCTLLVAAIVAISG